MLVLRCETCGVDFKAYPSDERRYCGRACVPKRLQSLTHGMSKTRLYGIWNGMKSRCMNPTCPTFDYYGGRGVQVFPTHRCTHSQSPNRGTARSSATKN